MVQGQVEHRGDAALRLAVTHEAAIAAAAQGQGKGVEQDRFARTGLPGQDTQPRPEIQFEPVDQNDVADRELRQHAATGFLRMGPQT